MRILYYSDIHTELRKSMTVPEGWTRTYPLSLGPDLQQYRGNVDLVILAGDIGTIREVLDTSAIGYWGRDSGQIIETHTSSQRKKQV